MFGRKEPMRDIFDSFVFPRKLMLEWRNSNSLYKSALRTKHNVRATNSTI